MTFVVEKVVLPSGWVLGGSFLTSGVRGVVSLFVCYSSTVVTAVFKCFE